MFVQQSEVLTSSGPLSESDEASNFFVFGIFFAWVSLKLNLFVCFFGGLLLNTSGGNFKFNEFFNWKLLLQDNWRKICYIWYLTRFFIIALHGETVSTAIESSQLQSSLSIMLLKILLICFTLNRLISTFIVTREYSCKSSLRSVSSDFKCFTKTYNRNFSTFNFHINITRPLFDVKVSRVLQQSFLRTSLRTQKYFNCSNHAFF